MFLFPTHTARYSIHRVVGIASLKNSELCVRTVREYFIVTFIVNSQQLRHTLLIRSTSGCARQYVETKITNRWKCPFACTSMSSKCLSPSYQGVSEGKPAFEISWTIDRVTCRYTDNLRHKSSHPSDMRLPDVPWSELWGPGSPWLSALVTCSSGQEQAWRKKRARRSRSQRGVQFHDRQY